MKSKSMFFLTLAVIAVIALSACSLLPGGNTGAKPTPTQPAGLPTNIVLATSVPGQATAAPQPGGAGAAGISGQLYIDANTNGAQDPDEQAIAGVMVNLGTGACPGTTVSQTVSTADTPSYQFANLSQGDYCVSIDPTLPENAAVLGVGSWTAPQQAQGTITQVVKLKKQPKSGVDFAWVFSTLSEATAVPAPNGGGAQPTQEAAQPTPIPVLPTPTAFVQPPPAPQACVYRAAFLQDVTIPDGTVVAPGAQFVKTWRVQNTGSCSWGPGSGLSNLAFVGGDALGAPPTVPIPQSVAVGATTDLSINMVAPQAGGTYKSNWKLRADDGTLIGVGPGRVALYVLMRVQAGPPPTAVPPPTGIPPVGQPIVFAQGATEAEAQGHLPANGIATYTVDALANQNMQLSLSSNSNTARIAVLSPNGSPMAPQRGNPEGTYWQGNLPTTGRYTIQVLAGNGAPTANYSLNVTIPSRITFAPGAISAVVQGVTSNGGIVTYLLKANGGQTMTVNLVAPPNSAGITIYGLDDGQPLIRSQSGATSFNGQLPATQDYVIQVVPFGNNAVNYTLNITVQ
jgi:Ig-like domain from next to BRCA1 gene/SdrD B-like domain